MARKSELQQCIDDMTETITAREMEIEALKIARAIMQEQQHQRAPRKPRLVAAG